MKENIEDRDEQLEESSLWSSKLTTNAAVFVFHPVYIRGTFCHQTNFLKKERGVRFDD